MKKYLVVLCVVFMVGCSEKEEPDESRADMRKDTSVERTGISSMPWVDKPFSDWPQLLLTNEAYFEDSRSLYGASAFLIKNRSGKVFAATARHLIGPAGGVEPAIGAGDLDKVLKSWVLAIRNTDFSNRVNVTGAAPIGLDDPNLDWLILQIADQVGRLPATPLEMRDTPVKVGETVYLLGVPYSDKTSTQNLYKGKVTERADGNRFSYSIRPAANIRGFSGAPILDTKGFLVGVMSLWFEPAMQGEKYLEAGGEDIEPNIVDINNMK